MFLHKDKYEVILKLSKVYILNLTHVFRYSHFTVKIYYTTPELSQ